MNDQTRRQPAGVPTGGQFAAGARTEAEVALSDIPLLRDSGWTEDPRVTELRALRTASVEVINRLLPGGRATLPETGSRADAERVLFTDADGFNYLASFPGRADHVNVRVNGDGPGARAAGGFRRPGDPDRKTVTPVEVAEAVREAVIRSTRARVFDEQMDRAVQAWKGSGSGTATLDEGVYVFTANDAPNDYFRYACGDYRPGEERRESRDSVQFTLGTHAQAHEGRQDPAAQRFEMRLVGDHVRYFSDPRVDESTPPVAPWMERAVFAEVSRRNGPDLGAFLRETVEETRRRTERTTHER